MAGTQQMTQQSTNQSSGQMGQYFQDPALVQQLSQMLGGVGSKAAGQYMNFVSNPTASPLYTNQLSGLLQALQPSEAQARTSLQDTGRAAGMMSSGPFANAAARQESDILRNRQTMASQLLGQMFPQMTQALQQPMSLAEQLINAMKMQQSSQQASGQSSGQSSGTQTDPAQQSSGVTASQLLAALTGGNGTAANGPTAAQTGQPTGVTGGDTTNSSYYNPIQSYYNYQNPNDPGSNIFLGMPEGGSVDSVNFAPDQQWY